MMDKKQLKNEENISMKKFLRDYLNIGEPALSIFSSLSHSELKSIYRETYKLKLVSLPFEMVDKEDLYYGDILLVSDNNGHLAPYYNPIQISFEDILNETTNIEEYTEDKSTDSKTLFKRKN